MCKLLNISSSSLYYAKNKPAKKYNAEEEKLTQHIKEIFKNSRNNYGSRKIKVELKKKGIRASKQRIRRIMKENGLVSTYTVKQYKVHKQICNNDKIDNKLKRNFNQEERMKVIVSDLTYVNVAGKWNYICLMLDLYNREIVGYTAGNHKDADLVRKAITTIKSLTEDVELGKVYMGKVTKILQFGALVEVLPGKEGLLHISQISNERIKKVEDVLKVGDDILVKVTEIGKDDGKFSLTAKDLMKV